MSISGKTEGHVSMRTHSYAHFPRRSKFHPYVKFPTPRSKGHSGSHAHAAGTAWDIPNLCASYAWPTGLAGGGVIAIIECGGGWLPDDLTQFFGNVGQPQPFITDVSVDATTNNPGVDPTADFEVALDIQIAAASYYVATQNAATIRIYWTQDIAAGVRAATADGCDVCSISWGDDEAKWGKPAADDMEAAAAAATASGMIVFAASGDNDSSDGGPTPANVDLPGTCPHVIGCGGTRKVQSPPSETVWNNNPGQSDGQGTGGGYSTFFPMPAWQVAPNGPGRMVPDVSANADPYTGYNIIVNGAQQVVGGTSAVAPLYAGLFAAFGEKLGFVTPKLYLNQTCFNDITQGDNGAFRAGVGPDPCTGIGSAIGDRLANVLIVPTSAHVRFARSRPGLAAE